MGDVETGGGPARLLREGASVAAGQIATILARLVGLRLVTDVVGPSVFGEASLLLGLGILGMNLLCMPVLQAVVRFYPDARDAGGLADLRRLSGRWLVLGTAALIVLLGVGGPLYAHVTGTRISWVAFFVLGGIVALDVQRLFETNLLNAARRQGLYSLWTAADAWARPLAAVAIITWLGASTPRLLLGFGAGALAVNAVLTPRARTATRPEPGASGWADRSRQAVLRFMGPLIPLAVLNWTLSLSDRYILAGVSGAAVAGLYVAAYGLASQPFIAVASASVAVFRPVLFDAVARHDAAKERRTVLVWLGGLAAVFAAGWLLLWAGADLLERLLLAQDYRGTAPLLPWIGAAYAFQGFQYVFETMIYAQRRTAFFIPLNVLGAVVALAFYFVLIPRFGALGAAMASFGSLVVTCGASLFLAMRARRRRAPPA